MAFSDMVAAAGDIISATLGKPVALTLHHSSGLPDSVPISAPIIKNPAMEEDFVPGSSDGTGVLLLWMRPEWFDVPPVLGDTVTVNGVDYDVFAAPVDRQGGITLKMRRRVKRFDQ
jgi:hypothetical protein